MTYMTEFSCYRSSLIGDLKCDHERSKGPLRPYLGLNLLGKGFTPRLSMRDRGSRQERI